MLTGPLTITYTLPMALIVKVLKHIVSWDEVQASIELAEKNFNEALDKALAGE